MAYSAVLHAEKRCSCAGKRLPNLAHVLRMQDRNIDAQFEAQLHKVDTQCENQLHSILPKVVDP